MINLIIDCITKKTSEFFMKKYTQDEYFKKILTTPDKDSWGGENPYTNYKNDEMKDEGSEA